MGVVKIGSIGIKGMTIDGNTFTSSFPVTENYYLKSDSDIELISVALMYKYYDSGTETFAINAGIVFRSTSTIYGGISESSITASVSPYNYNGYYYGFAYDGKGENYSTSEISLKTVSTDYYITYEQSNNIYPHEYNTSYSSSALENSYNYVWRSWNVGTLDNDPNITPLSNEMSACERLDPYNSKGTTNVCKISVKKLPCVLKFTNCVPSAGIYTLHFFSNCDDINSDRLNYNSPKFEIYNTDGSYIAVDWAGWSEYGVSWKYHKITFEAKEAGSLYIKFRNIDNYYLSYVKLEAGEVATPWTPYGSSDYLIKPLTFGKLNVNMSVFIDNNSDDNIGFIYTIHCKGEIENIIIYHDESNQSMKINGQFKLDDIIIIDTRRGKKSITKNYRGNIENIINLLDNTSKWLQLQSGYNHISQGADSGAENMESTIEYTNEYEGV